MMPDELAPWLKLQREDTLRRALVAVIRELRARGLPPMFLERTVHRELEREEEGIPWSRVSR